MATFTRPLRFIVVHALWYPARCSVASVTCIRSQNMSGTLFACGRPIDVTCLARNRYRRVVNLVHRCELLSRVTRAAEIVGQYVAIILPQRHDPVMAC